LLSRRIRPNNATRAIFGARASYVRCKIQTRAPATGRQTAEITSIFQIAARFASFPADRMWLTFVNAEAQTNVSAP
jgi:hypothetical protein